MSSTAPLRTSGLVRSCLYSFSTTLGRSFLKIVLNTAPPDVQAVALGPPAGALQAACSMRYLILSARCRCELGTRGISQSAAGITCEVRPGFSKHSLRMQRMHRCGRLETGRLRRRIEGECQRALVPAAGTNSHTLCWPERKQGSSELLQAVALVT